MHKINTLTRDQLLQYPYAFSLDVVALYTSIPPQEAIESVKTRLNAHSFNYHGLKTEHIIKLLETVLKRRIFIFKNILYEQKNGLAMGSRLSGFLATFVMDDLERRTITADLQIGFYARYVDDT